MGHTFETGWQTAPLGLLCRLESETSRPSGCVGLAARSAGHLWRAGWFHSPLVQSAGSHHCCGALSLGAEPPSWSRASGQLKISSWKGSQDRGVSGARTGGRLAWPLPVLGLPRFLCVLMAVGPFTMCQHHSVDPGSRLLTVLPWFFF